MRYEYVDQPRVGRSHLLYQRPHQLPETLSEVVGDQIAR